MNPDNSKIADAAILRRMLERGTLIEIGARIAFAAVFSWQSWPNRGALSCCQMEEPDVARHRPL